MVPIVIEENREGAGAATRLRSPNAFNCPLLNR